MNITWNGESMATALARIDDMRAEVEQSHQTICALVIELARLRLEVSDRDAMIANRDGRIADLNARVIVAEAAK